VFRLHWSYFALLYPTHICLQLENRGPPRGRSSFKDTQPRTQVLHGLGLSHMEGLLQGAREIGKRGASEVQSKGEASVLDGREQKSISVLCWAGPFSHSRSYIWSCGRAWSKESGAFSVGPTTCYKPALGSWASPFPLWTSSTKCNETQMSLTLRSLPALTHSGSRKDGL
jgi:hypothetical protein